jgi:hypothetical protein
VLTSPYLLFLVGSVGGLSVAVLLVALGPPAEFTALALIAGLTSRMLLASGEHWLLSQGPLYPIADEAKAITEVDAVVQARVRNQVPPGTAVEQA